ncbi:MAG: chaperone modulator CbpM [Francisellaceae bacterium]
MKQYDVTILTNKEYLTTQELAQLLKISESLISEWIEFSVIEAELHHRTFHIPGSEITKARSALRLAADLGVNPAGIAIIHELRARIKALEALFDKNL